MRVNQPKEIQTTFPSIETNLYNPPEVPPISRFTTWEIWSKSETRLVPLMLCSEMAARMPWAPAFKVSPQSPSPAIVSYLVISGSAEINAWHAHWTALINNFGSLTRFIVKQKWVHEGHTWGYSRGSGEKLARRRHTSQGLLSRFLAAFRGLLSCCIFLL